MNKFLKHSPVHPLFSSKKRIPLPIVQCDFHTKPIGFVKRS